MPPNDGGTLGSANVRITADTSDLNAKVDQAKAKVAEVGTAAENTGKTAKQAWDEMAGGAKEAGDAAEKAGEQAAEAATDWAAKSAGVLATLLLVKQALAEVKDFIETTQFDGFLAAGEILQKIQGAPAGSRVQSIREELAKLNNELEATERDWLNVGAAFGAQFAGRNISSIKTEIEALQSAQNAAGAEVLRKKNDQENEAREMQLERDIAAANKRAEAEIEAQKKVSEDRMKTYAAIAEAQAAMVAQVEKETRATERLNQTRLQGILAAQTALDRLYATQAAGFNGEGSNNSLEGAINALEIAVRGAAARMGGL